MSSSNDPNFTETMMRHVEELAGKKKELNSLKKDIKNNPDERYLKRKELGKECKELEALICEELDDDDEVLIGRRRFKKQRTEMPKFTKNRVIEFLEHSGTDPEAYIQENIEEKVVLKAIGKTK
tara:strand:+ start:116 stop:487 length:372 start_codon:yes stop_codon:yes gene_type:complete